MANAYTPPGVTAREVVSPSLNPVYSDSNTIAIVGPAQGYESLTENVLLNDKDWYTLLATSPSLSTIRVVNGADLTQTAYVASTTASGTDNDYVVDSSSLTVDGTVRIRRAMQTAIDSGETVVVYFENSASPTQADAVTQEIALSGVATTSLAHLSSTTQSSTISVQGRGIAPTADYTISGAGTSSVTITRSSSATILERFQNIWVDYSIASNEVQKVQINGGPTGGTFTLTYGVDTTSTIVYNPSAGAVQSALEALASIGSGNVSVTRTGTGTAGDPFIFTVTFIGSLAGTNATQITGSGASLTGGTSPSISTSTTTAGGVVTDYTAQAFQLDYSGGSDQAITLPAYSTGHVVRNSANVTGSTAAIAYSKGTTEDNDYMLVTTNSDVTTTTIRRSYGTTTIGNTDGRGQVQITYQATPTTYWSPTVVTSPSAAEDIFGSAFNADGSVNSPLAFGIHLAFQAGATSVVGQALFSETSGVAGAPTGVLADWEDTYNGMRSFQGINIVVPLPSTGGFTSSDETVLSILNATANHLIYMKTVGTNLTVVAGEDATDGVLAQPSVLQNHGTSIGATSVGDSIELLTPGTFQYVNPVTGQVMNIGGQYAACVYAGRMANNGVANSMTRKVLPTLRNINITRSPADKNVDAASGLTVLEMDNGVVTVRHSLSTAASQSGATVTQREFNVVRGKYEVIDTVTGTLNSAVVGNINNSAVAAITIQGLVMAALDGLTSRGVINGYDASKIQVASSPTDPTTVLVRFTYQPIFAINNISIQFSLDLTSGTVTPAASTATTG